jgi:hypothetical protein
LHLPATFLCMSKALISIGALLAFLVLTVSVQAQTTCQISGIILKPNNDPAPGVTIRVVKAQKSGSLFSVSPSTVTTGLDGTFTITAPRGPAAFIWISAPTQGFNTPAGTAVAVPDSATAQLQMLQAVTSPPAFLSVLVPQLIIVKVGGTLITNSATTINFQSGFAYTESPTGQINLTPSGIDAAKIGNGAVSNTEFGYLDGLNSSIQTQINARLDSTSPVTSGTFESTLSTGYLLTGPSMDGIYRGSTGNLSVPNSNFGIKTNAPLSVLDVNGGAAIGSYAGNNAAPSNSLIVSGSVGIGTASPSTALQVVGMVTARGVTLSTAGDGLFIKEGTNATMGTATCNGATEVTVSTNKVTATSRIFYSFQAPGGTPLGVVFTSARNAGTSFGFKCAASDTSTVAWLIIEPAP